MSPDPSLEHSIPASPSPVQVKPDTLTTPSSDSTKPDLPVPSLAKDEEKEEQGVLGEDDDDASQLRETLIDKLYSIGSAQKQQKSSSVATCASTPPVAVGKDLGVFRRTVKVSLTC